VVVKVFGMLLLLTGTIAIPATKSAAQSTPPPGINLPPNTPEQIERITPQPTPPSRPTPPQPLPSPPNLDIPTNPPTPEPSIPSSDRFSIRQINIVGNTVLKTEIEQLVQQFLQTHSQGVTFEELIDLRSRITQLYVDNGYITSGAFLPNNQVLDGGIIQIQVVEGSLERIDISGLRRLREGYIRQRLVRATQAPLNRRRLEEALQLLQLNPLLEEVNAELTAGSSSGQNVLQLQLKEASPFQANLRIDNYQTPSVGSLQGTISLSYNNLLGLGDRITADYARTEGLSLYNIGYTVPLSPSDTTLNVSYGNNSSRITEFPFSDAGIRGRSKTFSVSVRQPIIRTPQTEFAVSLGLDLRRNQTFLLDDIPFSFSEGPEDGDSRVTVIRFTQDWVNRGANRVLAARSQFSFGINAFDATVNSTGTDGQFFAWLGQFQWVQRLSTNPRSPILIGRLNAQLTPDSLLSLERFSIGGIDTVRGYRQNQLVTDNGITGTIEMQIPVTRNPETVRLVPFFEIGKGWNNRESNPDPSLIASLGLGVQWQITRELDLRLDYGIPLSSVRDQGDTLQDQGFNFSLRYQPFIRNTGR
jgi:hemolysin activation/secretion protein